MKGTILISGGTGLVGSQLTQLLLSQGYAVRHLSRKKRPSSQIQTFVWNIEEGYIEEGAFDGVSTIIHLAGAGVADGRWTKKRKQLILESRTLSTRLLFEKSREAKGLTSFISASAIGYYGMDKSDRVIDEDSTIGDGFLADVVRDWEKEIDQFSSADIRTVKIRIGVVLSKDGGALEKMITPIKYFVGSPLGTGKQYMSWIHIDDLCRLFLNAVEDQNFEGIYNGVAPSSVTNKVFTEKLAAALNRSLFLPNVPEIILRLVFGEMSSILLLGSNVVSKRLNHQNFSFTYGSLEGALNNLLGVHETK